MLTWRGVVLIKLLKRIPELRERGVLGYYT